MRFVKMHGLGNDYIFICCTEQMIEEPEQLARKISDRHFGVGADGLILICPSDRADFRMEMYNADGSRGRMCGNGIRCFAKYVYDYGMIRKKYIKIETDCGIKSAKMFEKNGIVERVGVDMGAPIFNDALVYLNILDMTTGDGGGVLEVDAVSMGNPHCVVFTDQKYFENNRKFFCDDILADTDQLNAMVARIQKLPCFPEGVNVEFVDILDDTRLSVRVWERGSGETLACGTGACAVVAASVKHGYTNRSVRVIFPGGELDVHWDEQEDTIYMTGPAVKVFEGEY